MVPTVFLTLYRLSQASGRYYGPTSTRRAVRRHHASSPSCLVRGGSYCQLREAGFPPRRHSTHDECPVLGLPSSPNYSLSAVSRGVAMHLTGGDNSPLTATTAVIQRTPRIQHAPTMVTCIGNFGTDLLKAKRGKAKRAEIFTGTSKNNSSKGRSRSADPWSRRG